MAAVSPPERWERCLGRKGARLMPLAGAAGRYGVFPRGDRRRRPLARLDFDAIQRAMSAGRLEKTPAGYRLSTAGRAALVRAGRQDFAAQHREVEERVLIDRDGRLDRVAANALTASPLARYRARLSPAQLQAGERFARDYWSSSLAAPVTRNWSLDAAAGRSSELSGPEDASLARIAAKTRVMDALAAVGTSLEPVLMAVLVREESLAAIERRFGWGARSGRAVLELALDALARHYRIRN